MTTDDKAALNAAQEWLARFAERKDHAMKYWAYEGDAELFARYIVTGRYPASQPAMDEVTRMLSIWTSILSEPMRPLAIRASG